MAKKSATLIDMQLKNVAKQVITSARLRLLSPTKTWNHHVDFRMKVAEESGDLHATTITVDDEYFWLDGGTKERWAVMSKDFVPKTQPKSFQASAGRGGMVYVIKKGRGGGPRPGIESREWTRLASLEYGNVLQIAIDKEVAKIANGKRLFVSGGRARRFIVEE